MLRPSVSGLELRMRPTCAVERRGQPAVVADHPRVALASRLAQPEPHLERAEAAAVLQAQLVVVDGRLLALGLEAVVGRRVAERLGQPMRVAHQHAAGLERRVEPLVRVHRQRVGQAERVEIVGRVGQHRGRGAVRAVHVEPESVRPGRSSASSRSGSTAPVLTLPGGADHHDRPVAARARSARICPQRVGAHALAASTGIQRMASVPRPNRSAAFWIQVWVAADA